MTALLALVGVLVALIAKLAVLTAAVIVYVTELFDNPVVTDTVSWGLILGVVTPMLTSIVQQPRWSNRTRAVIGALVSVVIGVLTCLANGDISNAKTVLATVAVVLVAAHATYSQFWKPTGIAPAMESATSPTPRNGVG